MKFTLCFIGFLVMTASCINSTKNINTNNEQIKSNEAASKIIRVKALKSGTTVLINNVIACYIKIDNLKLISGELEHLMTAELEMRSVNISEGEIINLDPNKISFKFCGLRIPLDKILENYPSCGIFLHGTSGDIEVISEGSIQWLIYQ